MVLASAASFAQKTCVVADKLTHAPIARASIYGHEAGKFRSVITSEQGVARITFHCSTYTVSHLNYEKEVLKSFADTVFLTPKYYQAGEIIVKSEPDWIRPLLRRFVKEKNGRYLSSSSTYHYNYSTRSIEGRSFYQYKATGKLRSPLPESKLFAISPDTGMIVSVDSTRLTDVTNMRRMLYEYFVQEFDKSFIHEHKFSVGDDVEGDNPDEVELIFRSKKKKADRGRFIIDTVRCVIRSATREMGTDYNKSHRVSSVMLAFSRMLTGYHIDDWNVSYGVSYASYDGVYYPQDVRYKFYYQAFEKTADEQSSEFDRESGGGFSNMEAEMHLRPERLSTTKLVVWTPLPRPWYIKINTDDERKQEVALAHLPAKFQLYTSE